MEDPRIIVENEVRQIQPQNENDLIYGPLELNLIERVEQGLNESDKSYSKQIESNNDKKYNGQKEIIFVSGWANIDKIYNQYVINFLIRIILGFSIVITMLYYQQNLTDLFYIMIFLSFVFVMKNAASYQKFMQTNEQESFTFWVELNNYLSYFVYFVGFCLVFKNFINQYYLPLFVLPHLLLSCFIVFFAPKDKVFVTQNKFILFESIQLLLIAIKFGFPMFLNWNYVLLFFMASAVYLFVLGLLMSVILSCCVFGFLYRDIEDWKVKSLIWMTWYYLWSGVIYVYMIKGVIIYYGANLLNNPAQSSYIHYHSSHDDLIIAASFMMIFCSLVNLVFHHLWKKEIKRYLSKVIYRNDVRKEISVRSLAKSFTFNLIQISSTYFIRKDKKIEKSKIEIKEEEMEEQISVQNSKKEIMSKYDDQLCVFCYENQPNILIDSCCHGGVCQDCIINYLKKDEGKCPFCKKMINKLYVLKYNQEKEQLFATSEIKFKKQLIQAKVSIKQSGFFPQLDFTNPMLSCSQSNWISQFLIKIPPNIFILYGLIPIQYYPYLLLQKQFYGIQSISILSFEKQKYKIGKELRNSIIFSYFIQQQG